MATRDSLPATMQTNCNISQASAETDSHNFSSEDEEMSSNNGRDTSGDEDMSGSSDRSEHQRDDGQGQSSEPQDMTLVEEKISDDIISDSVSTSVDPDPVATNMNMRTDEVIPVLPRAFDSDLAVSYVPHHEDPRFRLTSKYPPHFKTPPFNHLVDDIERLWSFYLMQVEHVHACQTPPPPDEQSHPSFLLDLVTSEFGHCILLRFLVQDFAPHLCTSAAQVLPSSAVTWFSLPWIPCSFYVLVDSPSHLEHVATGMHALAGVSGFYTEVLKEQWSQHFSLPPLEPSRPPNHVPPTGWVKISNHAESVYREDYGFVAFRSLDHASAFVVLVPRVCKTCSLWENRGLYCSACLISRPEAQPWRFPLNAKHAHLRFDQAALRGFVFGLFVECMPSRYLEFVPAVPDFVSTVFRDHLDSASHMPLLDPGYQNLGIHISLPPVINPQTLFDAGDVVYLLQDVGFIVVPDDDGNASGGPKTKNVAAPNWFRVAGVQGTGREVLYVILADDPVASLQHSVDELAQRGADEAAFDDLPTRVSGRFLLDTRLDSIENMRKLIQIGDRCSCPFIGLKDDGPFKLVQVFPDGVATVKKDEFIYTIPNTNFLTSKEKQAIVPREAFRTAVASDTLVLWSAIKSNSQGRSSIPRCESWVNRRVKIHSSPMARISNSNRLYFGQYGVVKDYRWVTSNVFADWGDLHPSNVKVTVCLDIAPPQSNGIIVCDLLELRVEDPTGLEAYLDEIYPLKDQPHAICEPLYGRRRDHERYERLAPPGARPATPPLITVQEAPSSTQADVPLVDYSAWSPSTGYPIPPAKNVFEITSQSFMRSPVIHNKDLVAMIDGIKKLGQLGVTKTGHTAFTFQKYNHPHSVDLSSISLDYVSTADLRGTKRLLRIVDPRSRHFGESCVRVGTVHRMERFYLVLERNLQMNDVEVPYFTALRSQLAWASIKQRADDAKLNGIRDIFRTEGYAPAHAVDI